jgi:hypothetical protein
MKRSNRAGFVRYALAEEAGTAIFMSKPLQ